MESHWDGLSEILVRIGERIEGNLICDIDVGTSMREQNHAKIQNLQHLARGKRRICEVGVNAGHSLLLMLEVNPTADYVLFDIGTHTYTRPCLEYIRSRFASTSIEIVYGDSKQTLPLAQGEFDLIHIDGGHTEPDVKSDFGEAMRLIAPGCPIVFDDFDYDCIHRVLAEHLRDGTIRLYEDSDLLPTDRHLIFTDPKKASLSS